MNIGKAIKIRRQNSLLTQDQFRLKAGLSRKQIGDIENNRYNSTMEIYSRIAKAFDCRLSTLIREAEDLD